MRAAKPDNLVLNVLLTSLVARTKKYIEKTKEKK